MNPAKRRRLDATASTLSKPFRSPLKVTSSHRTALQNAKKEHADHQATTPCKIQSATSTLPTNHVEKQDITELQREYAALTQQLRKLRQDLDAVEQAHRIQSTGQEEKLICLVSKWRTIARDAADEVFESASSRVKDMGGLHAWQKNAISSFDQDHPSGWYDKKRDRSSSDSVDSSQEDTGVERIVGNIDAEKEEVDYPYCAHKCLAHC